MKAERLQKAFQWGYNCFVKGLMSSPFKRGSMTDLEWHRGFNEAYYNNLDYLSGKGAKPSEYKDDSKRRPRNNSRRQKR